MEKILISACLVGDKTRYDGKSSYSPLISKILEKYELIPFCCEVEGGLPIPRDPSERQKDGKIINSKGKDVTKYYKRGAELACTICSYNQVKVAILKEGSPACGVHEIHDGKFTNKKIPGQGVLAEELTKRGIKVYTIEEFEKLL